ncbi:MAG: hypothetical protein QOK18_413 [Mycobacterium sp.]|nr:hypothetical protein [Mycobacterium sp.]MDT7758995.1 hypothetical protein [Mycobacterium sp.]
MNVSVRSCLTAGIATITAATVAFVLSVAESTAHSMPRSAPTVRTVSAPFALTAQSKADPPSGAKDRGHRRAKDVKAGAKD